VGCKAEWAVVPQVVGKVVCQVDKVVAGCKEEECQVEWAAVISRHAKMHPNQPAPMEKPLHVPMEPLLQVSHHSALINQDQCVPTLQSQRVPMEPLHVAQR